MDAQTGQPDWAAAIDRARVEPPAVIAAALARAEAERAALVAKLAAAHHREE